MRLRSQQLKPPRLPPELIDDIIDHLHDFPSDLKNCALVCRAWLPSSHRHLFYCVAILQSQTQSTADRAQELHEIIQNSPITAHYVRQFHFTPSTFSKGQRGWHSEWSVLDKVLPQLLKAFTKLQLLSIERINWGELTPGLRKSFRAVLALLSLIDFRAVDLRLNKLEYFIGLINPHLKRLTASVSQWSLFNYPVVLAQALDKEDKESKMLVDQPCRLEFLSINCTPDLVDLLLQSKSFVDISNIHTLKASISKTMTDAVRLMRSIGPSLEHLTILEPHELSAAFFFFLFVALTYPDYVLIQLGWIHPDTLDVGHHPNIKTLSLHYPYHHEPPPYLKALLSHLAPLDIRRINLKFAFTTDTDGADWKMVDHVLSSGNFAKLESVEIRINQRRIRREVLTWFSSLHARGLLKVVVDLDYSTIYVPLSRSYLRQNPSL
jgi:hypothetical protein